MLILLKLTRVESSLEDDLTNQATCMTDQKVCQDQVRVELLERKRG